MADPIVSQLNGKCVLLVEDEYLFADELEQALTAAGARIVGPHASVAEAAAAVEREGDRLDAAVLDINLRGSMIYAVADTLLARGIPVVFATGYDTEVIPAAYDGIARCVKPIAARDVASALAAQV